MKFTDTHCHLDLQTFDADREAVIDRALAAGLTHLLIPALDLPSSRRILALAQLYPAVFAATGVHPTEVESMAAGTLEELGSLARDAKVVAIGEVGLDYFWVTDRDAHVRQRRVLEAQLDLARRLERPVIIHLRESGDAAGGPCTADLMAILERWVGSLRAESRPLSKRPGVLHSFSGTLETALQAIALGFHVGVTGPVTYKNASDRRRVIGGLPLDRLLIETDSPFLAPVPHRGERNEPAFVTHIADKIAEIQSRTLAEVANVTEANAARLFAWGETV